MKKRLLLLALALPMGGAAHAQNPEIIAGQAAQLAAPGVANVAGAGEKVELKLRWQAGKSYLQTVRNENKISQTIDGQRVDTTQTMGMELLYAVKDVDALGAAGVEVTFRAVTFKALSKAGKDEMRIEYDSEHPPKEVHPAARALAALVGQKISMKMTPQGHALEVQGLKEMQERMFASLQLPAGRERAMLEATMKKQFGEEAMQQMLEKNTSGFYPDGPVAVGESWTRNLTMGGAFPLTLAVTYTLRERQDGLSLLDTKARIALDSSGKPMQAAGAKISMQLNGAQSGTLSLRESDGWVMKMQSAMRFSGTMTMSSAPSSPADLARPTTKSWPIYSAGTVTMETEDLP